VLFVLICACNIAPAHSNAHHSSVDDDCASDVSNEAARVFFRSRVMHPGDVFACHEVEHLGLGGGAFTGSDIRFFVPALLRMQQLKTLDLSHMSLTSDDLNVLAPVLTQLHALQRLSLNGNALGHSGAAVLASSVSSSSLEWLQLEHTEIGAEGLRVLVPLLLRQNSTLTWLNLENCDLRPLGATVLASILGAFKQLHELNIARNSLGDSGGSTILSASPWNSLRKLWLGSNALTCASLEHLRGSGIQLLDLSFNALAPGCSTPLTTALLQMPNLHSLHLNGNALLDDASATAFAGVFHSLPSLSHVSMAGLGLSKDTRHTVAGKHQLLAFETALLWLFFSCPLPACHVLLRLMRRGVRRNVPTHPGGLLPVAAARGCSRDAYGIESVHVIAFTVNEVAAEVSRDQGGKGPT
jgi:Ran GTPase-activating protein (RanGAP) involved in mRNA processing and transport